MSREKNFAVCVRLKPRTKGQTRGSYNHNLRLGHIPNYVDQGLMHLNTTIIQPPTPHECVAIANDLRSREERQRAMRSDAAITHDLVITFGKDVQPFVRELSIEDQDRMYLEIAEAVTKRLAASLLGLVSHRDETAPHAHGTVSSYNDYGASVSKVASKKVLSEIQDLANEIGKKYVPQIERGVRKADRIKRGDDQSKIIHRNVKQLHEDLPKEIEAAEQELTLTLTKIDESKAKLEKAEDLRRKAEQKRKEAEQRAQDFEKLKKRAETYERRAEKAEASLSVLETQKSDLEQKIAVLQSKHAELTEREMRAQQRERELGAKQNALAERARSIEEERLNSLKTEAEFEAQRVLVNERYQAAKDREKINIGTTQDLEQRETAVKTKEAEVVQRELRVETVEANLTQHKEALIKRATEVTQREASVTQKEGDIVHRERAAERLLAQAKTLFSRAERREVLTAEQADKLLERERVVSQKEETLKMLGAKLRRGLDLVTGVIGTVAEKLGIRGDDWDVVVDEAYEALEALERETGPNPSPW